MRDRIVLTAVENFFMVLAEIFQVVGNTVGAGLQSSLFSLPGITAPSFQLQNSHIFWDSVQTILLLTYKKLNIQEQLKK
jgi:hypothetical protein